MRKSVLPSALFLLSIVVSCADPPKTPTAVETPAPTPSPTPTPTPTPALGTGLACGLPARPECGGPEGPPGIYGCCRNEAGGQIGRGEFDSRVNQAIDILMGERPDLFRGEQVLDVAAYTAGLARILERDFRLCSKPGQPGDEIAVKNSNSYNEQYDVLISTGRVRRSGLVASCQPARF
jgi:hypothetical protein